MNLELRSLHFRHFIIISMWNRVKLSSLVSKSFHWKNKSEKLMKATFDRLDIPTEYFWKKFAFITIIIIAPELQSGVRGHYLSLSVSVCLCLPVFLSVSCYSQQVEWNCFSVMINLSVCRGEFFISMNNNRPPEIRKRVWRTQLFNYDNVAAAMLTLFAVQTGEGWPQYVIPPNINS